MVLSPENLLLRNNYDKPNAIPTNAVINVTRLLQSLGECVIDSEKVYFTAISLKDEGLGNVRDWKEVYPGGCGRANSEQYVKWMLPAIRLFRIRKSVDTFLNKSVVDFLKSIAILIKSNEVDVVSSKPVLLNKIKKPIIVKKNISLINRIKILKNDYEKWISNDNDESNPNWRLEMPKLIRNYIFLFISVVLKASGIRKLLTIQFENFSMDDNTYAKSYEVLLLSMAKSEDEYLDAGTLEARIIKAIEFVNERFHLKTKSSISPVEVINLIDDDDSQINV